MGKYQQQAIEIAHSVAEGLRTKADEEHRIQLTGNSTINLAEFVEDTNSETKTAGLDVELKASDWKLEGQNIIGVISVLRGPKPGDKIRIEIPSEDHRKDPMVDGKPTRSVLTALCQRVRMRLGRLAQSAQKTHQRASVSHGRARLLSVQGRAATVLFAVGAISPVRTYMKRSAANLRCA